MPSAEASWKYKVCFHLNALQLCSVLWERAERSHCSDWLWWCCFQCGQTIVFHEAWMNRQLPSQTESGYISWFTEKHFFTLESVRVWYYLNPFFLIYVNHWQGTKGALWNNLCYNKIMSLSLDSLSFMCWLYLTTTFQHSALCVSLLFCCKWWRRPLSSAYYSFVFYLPSCSVGSDRRVWP